VNTRYCVVYGEACESGPRAQRISVRLLLEVLRERVENAATTIRNNRGFLRINTLILGDILSLS
jgi:hypothetical protein